MASATIKAGNRLYTVTAATQANVGWPFLEIGPAGTTEMVSVHAVQFNFAGGFDGSFVVMGRVMGQAALDRDVPFGPIPYKRITLANVAQDYAISTAVISTSALIHIPASGLSVVLQMTAPTVGQCDICMWDLQGSSAV